MEIIFGKLFENIQQLAKFAFPTLLVSIFLLFIVENFDSLNFMLEFKNSNESLFIIILLISLIITLYQLFNLFKKLFCLYNRKNKLANLTLEEKNYLKPYINEDITSKDFIVTDGIAGGLVMKEILYKSTPNRGISHNLSDWARKTLIKNPSYLE